MSGPLGFPSPTPNRIVSSSAGTEPFSLYIILSSKKTTGLSSRIALFRRPFASYGVDGNTTFNPGMWQDHACSDCECCAADRRVAPSEPRMTLGTLHLPSDVEWTFAAGLTF